ncbi:MAG: GNAT family N-acetyltransferase [Gemmatimonadaceae bacterium]|nr:GNAT family N-acetyltransferase [Gemmatimonadaceae bacterium]
MPTPPPTTTRWAHVADAAAYARCAAASFREAYADGSDDANLEVHVARHFSEAIQRSELQDPRLRLLVAEDPAGSWAGFALLRGGSRAEGVRGARPVEIVRFYTRAAWYGRGVGAQLMDGALAAAREAGHDEAWLQVWEGNARAIRFYEKSGFVARGRNPFRFGDVWEKDLVYARSP